MAVLLPPLRVGEAVREWGAVRAIDSLIFRVLDRKARRLGAVFSAAAAKPWEVQAATLSRILRRETPTAFGRDHDFAGIRSGTPNVLEDFRRRVPVAGHEALEPYLQRVFAGETTALFHKQRVRMFAMTSGTSAARKYVPVTDEFIRIHRQGWFVWALQTYEGRQKLLLQPKFNLGGDDDEFRSAAGIPCGSISGLTSRMQPRLIARSYCLPNGTAKLAGDAKSYLSWRVGLVRDVGSWISPNPSTHLNLARFGDAHRELLIRDIRDGGLNDRFDYPTAVRRSVRQHLKPNPTRARELEAIVRRTGHLYPKDVWPNFGLLGCWLGGPLAAYLRFFPDYFGDVPRRDLGLIASEGRMTIPLVDGTAAGVPDLSGSVFEFVPVDEVGSVSPTVLQPHELIEGRDYFILLTTASGLYRYDIQDVVRCVGWFGRTPLIEFQHKGKHISNLTGEKLSEIQVSRGMDAACDRLRLRLDAYALAPCFQEELPYYGLFVEADELPDRRTAAALAARLDVELKHRNCEYEAKRDSWRLGPVRLQPLAAGAWAAFDRNRVRASGAAIEQYKRPCLIPDLAFAATMPAAATMPSAAPAEQSRQMLTA